MWKKTENFLLDLFFPKFCFGCSREGDYLCEDCQSVLQISGFHKNYSTQNLKNLYYPLFYQNPLIKNLIQKFKYEPFIKELEKVLSNLIITHFQLMDNKPDLSDFVLIPIPLEKGRLRWRGFNQAEELGKSLSVFFNIPMVAGLIKTRRTVPQVELTDEVRKENVKGIFQVQNKESIKDRQILLVDDVYTTGATMEECARVLKEAGAKEIIGIVVARG